MTISARCGRRGMKGGGLRGVTPKHEIRISLITQPEVTYTMYLH
jgi:hypothetical protein